MSYAVDIRRKIHEYPEVGFDLPRTLALVRSELEKLGIPYTEKYGKSSIVATLNEEKSQYTIAIRADMDALPIIEQCDVPYKSKIEGQMHACGHDAHTAMLLDTARRLSQQKEKINCRVKFLFQPAEEFPPSGAKLMCEDGVMDDIDCIVALHVEPGRETGLVAIAPGPSTAISSGFHIELYGKSAHAAHQEDGIDAISMAVKVFSAIELMIAKEFSPKTVRIFNVGSIHGGTANNVICDHTSMYCTLRSWDEETDAKATRRIKEIIECVAKESGGRGEYVQDKYYPIVYNDDALTARMRASIVKVVGEEHIQVYPRSVGGEDFAYYASRKPGCMFRLGVRNVEKDCVYSTHQDRFNLDEDAMEIGARVFEQFVLDNMDNVK